MILSSEIHSFIISYLHITFILTNNSIALIIICSSDDLPGLFTHHFFFLFIFLFSDLLHNRMSRMINVDGIIAETNDSITNQTSSGNEQADTEITADLQQPSNSSKYIYIRYFYSIPNSRNF